MNKIVMIAALAGSATVAMAQTNYGGLLTDGDARFRFGTTTAGSAGLPTVATSTSNVSTDFFINSGGTSVGGADLTFSSIWGYGTMGRTREFQFANATSRSVSGNTGTWGWTNFVSGLNASLTSTIWDNALGANTAQVRNVMTFTNTTGADIELDLFWAVDNDVNGLSNTVDALALIDGHRVLVQRNNLYSATMIGFEADGSSNGAFTTVNGEITDAALDNFIPDRNPGGQAVSGDYAIAMQWRIVIPAGGSMSVRGDLIGQFGSATFVPTPGSAALLGMGMLAAGRRRRA